MVQNCGTRTQAAAPLVPLLHIAQKEVAVSERRVFQESCHLKPTKETFAHISRSWDRHHVKPLFPLKPRRPHFAKQKMRNHGKGALCSQHILWGLATSTSWQQVVGQSSHLSPERISSLLITFLTSHETLFWLRNALQSKDFRACSLGAQGCGNVCILGRSGLRLLGCLGFRVMS